jgi:hypothetical protein
MGDTLFTQGGIIRFYDGTIIAIERQEYSPDGITYWEEVFNPNDHLSSIDGVTPIKGHKYKRVMHSGDTKWQKPYKIVADTPEFRVTAEGNFEWKFIDEDVWKLLINKEDIKGEQGKQGEQGIPGEGFHINLYGFFNSRPDCGPNLANTCSTCNVNSTNSSDAITFMSLGDGALILTQPIINNGNVLIGGTTYTHFSNDLNTWSPISTGIVDLEVRYLATNATGAIHTDMHNENYYGTRGIVYVCAEGNWTVLTDIATPSYMVGESVGSTNIGYLDHFVSTSTNVLTNTITLNNGILSIIEQSITENAFNQNTFGDGISILNPMDKPQINVNDFVGFGLTWYISNTDGLNDIAVDATSLILDGLDTVTGISVDGEVHDQMIVNVLDLINNNSFLTSNVEPDTFRDLYVNIGDGLEGDGNTPQAIKVKADEVSLTVDATNLRVHPYTGTTTGITLAHLNPDIIWAGRGIDLNTANGLYIRVDSSTIGYNGTGQLEVPVNGITGDRLNDNTANNNEGIEVLNDMLSVKVDGTTIVFNGSGELEVTPMSIPTTVTSIVPFDNSTLRDAVREDIQFNINEGVGIETVFISDGSLNTLTLDIAFDTAWGDARYQQIGASSAVYWEGLARNNTNTETIEQYIAGLNHVELNHLYNNIIIDEVDGLIIQGPTNSFKIIVDDNGNLDTIRI